MKKYAPYVAVLLAVSITIGTGFVKDRLSGRWGPRFDMTGAAQRFESVPESFGDWRQVEAPPMEESVVRMLECKGYVNRVYVNSETRARVHVAVMLGPPGPIAVHTPEVCYSSRDYKIRAPREEVDLSINDDDYSFWKIAFEPKKDENHSLLVYYAWNNGQGWSASSSPRFEYGGSSHLYKIQLAVVVPQQATSKADDPCENFLTDFLPELNQTIVSE
jgi:hypothetical protein